MGTDGSNFDLFKSRNALDPEVEANYDKIYEQYIVHQPA